MQLVRKKRRHVFPRKKHTEEELITYLKQKNIRSKKQLQKQSSVGDPRLCHYRAVFGTWTAACEKAFGRRLDVARPENVAAYLMKCVLSYNVWTIAQWDSLHKSRPDIVPSFRSVRTHYGSWKNLKAVATRESMDRIVVEYRKLRRRLGRTPTNEECRDTGIDLCIVSKYFDKQEFEKYIADMERLEPNA